MSKKIEIPGCDPTVKYLMRMKKSMREELKKQAKELSVKKGRPVPASKLVLTFIEEGLKRGVK